MTYRPLRFFFLLGMVPFGVGTVLGVRFVWFYAAGEGSGHIQSEILASLLLSFGFLLWIVALLADLMSVNRKLLEKMSFRLHRLEDRVGRLRPEENEGG